MEGVNAVEGVNAQYLLWPVDDASTAKLMRALYASFSARRGDAALALQQARRALRSLSGADGVSYAKPYYWAGFSVSGSQRQIT